MTKSELVEALSLKQPHLLSRDVEAGVRIILRAIEGALARDDRVEIRGFGVFTMIGRAARIGRNPKTGGPVLVQAKKLPHFKPGKELRERVQTAGSDVEAAELQAAD
jgi:integration host factor subunit beta